MIHDPHTSKVSSPSLQICLISYRKYSYLYSVVAGHPLAVHHHEVGPLDDEQHSDGHPPPQLGPHARLPHPGSDRLVHLERGGGVALEPGRVGLTLPVIKDRLD